ncbi:MAG: D-glycero-beta-D-manno-heptose-7-phosphate kinase [Candidatus Omnitrophica bacterium]|nr:D-glycero-beta-D-manno-heptose-7-phosphate kinase [Candidatus Omnitrophota bacterium]
MKHLEFERLRKIIRHFDNTSILVVGDLMLDEFIWGKVSRISPEAPVPVVWATSESVMPGGASNVANNIRSLGGNVYLAGVVGNDERGKLLLEELSGRGINTGGIIRDSERPTTLKTRVIAHNQQVVRIDKEKVADITDSAAEKILDFSDGIMDDIDAVIIEDYGKGVIVPRLLSPLIRIAKKHGKIITVDPKENHFPMYKNVTAITPNHYEAAKAVGMRPDDGAPIEEVGKKLLKRLNCEVALVTLGENGMCVFEKSGRITKISTVAQEVYDVSGAGDTVISAYTLALSSGAKTIEAAHVANCAAGIVVGKVGIAVTTQGELIDKIKAEIKNSHHRENK